MRRSRAKTGKVLYTNHIITKQQLEFINLKLDQFIQHRAIFGSNKNLKEFLLVKSLITNILKHAAKPNTKLVIYGRIYEDLSPPKVNLR